MSNLSLHFPFTVLTIPTIPAPDTKFSFCNKFLLKDSERSLKMEKSELAT